MLELGDCRDINITNIGATIPVRGRVFSNFKQVLPDQTGLRTPTASNNVLFRDDIPSAVGHSVAEDFFLRVTNASRSSRDAVEFLTKILVLYRDMPNDYIHLIDVKIERVAQNEELIIPTSKECGLYNKIFKIFSLTFRIRRRSRGSRCWTRSNGS